MRTHAPGSRRAVPGLLLSSGLAACLATGRHETADVRTTAIGAGPNSETALAIGGRLPV